MQVAIDSAVLTAEIMILVAASGIFSWLLTVGQAQTALVELFRAQEMHPTIVMLLIKPRCASPVCSSIRIPRRSSSSRCSSRSRRRSAWTRCTSGSSSPSTWQSACIHPLFGLNIPSISLLISELV
jgi:hypothetical protein